MNVQKEKPVLYLDVDDTFLMFPRQGNWLETYFSLYNYGIGCPGIREFIPWALENFEVRWLTMWKTTSQPMLHERLENLSLYTGVPIEQFQQIHNKKGFSRGFGRGYKTDAIDFDEVLRGRQFVWLEDEILPAEVSDLKAHGVLDWWIPCNTSTDPMALFKAWHKIKIRFKLDNYLSLIPDDE